jgi:hypothetical protein
VRDAIDALLRFTDKPIIALKEAVSSGLVQACLDGLRGIGRGPNLSRNWASTFNLRWKPDAMVSFLPMIRLRRPCGKLPNNSD